MLSQLDQMVKVLRGQVTLVVFGEHPQRQQSAEPSAEAKSSKWITLSLAMNTLDKNFAYLLTIIPISH